MQLIYFLSVFGGKFGSQFGMMEEDVMFPLVCGCFLFIEDIKLPEIKDYNAYLQKLLPTPKAEAIVQNQRTILKALLDALFSISKLESDIQLLKERTKWLGEVKKQGVKIDEVDIKKQIAPRMKIDGDVDDIEPI